MASLLWRRSRLVLLLTVAFVGAAAWGAVTVGPRLASGEHAGFIREDAPSERAAPRVMEATGSRLSATVVALIEPRDPATVEHVVAAMQARPEIARVETMVSTDGGAVYAAAFFRPGRDEDVRDAQIDRVRAAIGTDPRVTVVRTDRTFDQINDQLGHDLPLIELFAVPALFLLSFLVFRGLIAALLPILVAAVAVAGTLLGVRLLTEFMTVSPFALNLASGLGLGLAIDYALLMVSRYREELAAQGPGPGALAATLASAGRTVMFSATTVAAALLCLVAFGLSALRSMGLAGAMVALMAAFAAVVPMSALLALLGERVNALAPRRLQRAAHRTARPTSEGGWYRLAHLVMRRPGVITLVCVAGLALAGLPALQTHLGFTDARALPAGFATSDVAQAIDERFPGDAVHPILAVADGSAAEVDRYTDQLRRLPGAQQVQLRRLPDGDRLVTVLSRDLPDEPVTQGLVADMRALHPGFPVAMTGSAAINYDEGRSVGARLPLAAVLLALSTLLVLFVMTRSILLPLKAVLMNVVTGTATVGLLVVLFQDGHLAKLLDFQHTGYLDRNNLILLLFLVLGLSTDYGVFLLARIKEAHDGGASNREAVARGLERSGRIVTAAALLFCVAVGASAFSEVRVVKEFAVGASLAVLIDATIIRVLLVPALMALLGEANWWAPRFLRARRPQAEPAAL